MFLEQGTFGRSLLGTNIAYKMLENATLIFFPLSITYIHIEIDHASGPSLGLFPPMIYLISRVFLAYTFKKKFWRAVGLPENASLIFSQPDPLSITYIHIKIDHASGPSLGLFPPMIGWL